MVTVIAGQSLAIEGNVIRETGVEMGLYFIIKISFGEGDNHDDRIRLFTFPCHDGTRLSKWGIHPLVHRSNQPYALPNPAHKCELLLKAFTALRVGDPTTRCYRTFLGIDRNIDDPILWNGEIVQADGFLWYTPPKNRPTRGAELADNNGEGFHFIFAFNFVLPLGPISLPILPCPVNYIQLSFTEEPSGVYITPGLTPRDPEPLTKVAKWEDPPVDYRIRGVFSATDTLQILYATPHQHLVPSNTHCVQVKHAKVSTSVTFGKDGTMKVEITATCTGMSYQLLSGSGSLVVNVQAGFRWAGKEGWDFDIQDTTNRDDSIIDGLNEIVVSRFVPSPTPHENTNLPVRTYSNTLQFKLSGRVRFVERSFQQLPTLCIPQADIVDCTLQVQSQMSEAVTCWVLKNGHSVEKLVLDCGQSIIKLVCVWTLPTWRMLANQLNAVPRQLATMRGGLVLRTSDTRLCMVSVEVSSVYGMRTTYLVGITIMIAGLSSGQLTMWVDPGAKALDATIRSISPAGEVAVHAICLPVAVKDGPSQSGHFDRTNTYFQLSFAPGSKGAVRVVYISPGSINGSMNLPSFEVPVDVMDVSLPPGYTLRSMDESCTTSAGFRKRGDPRNYFTHYWFSGQLRIEMEDSFQWDIIRQRAEASLIDLFNREIVHQIVLFVVFILFFP